jgi:hypothetical protein
MTYRQLVTDFGLAVLLAAPTLVLARPHAALPASTTIAEEKAAAVPLAQVAKRSPDSRG